MENKKSNIVLGIILAILMVIAIVIVIVNPNKVETVNVENTNYIENQIDTNQQINGEKIKDNTNKISQNDIEKEEKQLSMQDGGKFCKIDNTVVFYENQNKSIYTYNISNNITSKLVTLEVELDKIYFDGENIFAIPTYQSGKGIYKIDLNGEILKIYDDSSLQLCVTENKIYFVKQIGYDNINQNPQGTLCSMEKDGTNITDIAENIKNYFFMQEDKIYYTTQNRKLYQINIDGTEQTELAQGRKFTIAINDKYLIYIDYAEQEAKHMINLETKEDAVIGYFGTVSQYCGKIYVSAKKRAEDGAIEEKFTLFEIEQSGKVNELGTIDEIDANLKYVINGKLYVFTQQEGTSIIDLDSKEKQSVENYNGNVYFIGGYAYKIDNSNLDDIKVERIEL